MRNFQEKKGWRRIIQSWPVLIILGIILIFFSYAVLRFTLKMVDTSKNKKIAENKVAELQESKEKLSNDIEKLRTEKGVEETIRDKFGLVKEGEGLIIVVDSKEEPELEDANKSGWLGSVFSNWFK